MNQPHPDHNQSLGVVAFGGGCFWCTEAVFLSLKGVLSVTSGYAGGHTANPTYEQVSMGSTGHAEVIRVEYDPAVVTFAKLLEVFFASHDPTTVNRQGNDVGTQYRSIILYSTPEQKREAEEVMQKLDESGKFTDPIVTEVKSLDMFYPAEQYHQNYAEKNPDQPYVEVVVKSKVEKVEKKFADLLKEKV